MINHDAAKKSDSCVMIIFGATGDLTKRKLYPALYYLAHDGYLPANFAVIGVGRQEMTSKAFRDRSSSRSMMRRRTLSVPGVKREMPPRCATIISPAGVQLGTGDGCVGVGARERQASADHVNGAAVGLHCERRVELEGTLL